MSLAQPRTVFGVHTISPYDPKTGEFYGIARVVQGSTFKLEGDTIELKGGSNRFSWAVEDGDINAELSFSVSEYPNWLFTIFGGKAPTQGTAESGGFASPLTDKKGTTVVSAAGLLATITLSTPADLKMGRYVVKATAADAFKLFVSSSIDFGRGSAVDYTDDSLEIASVTGVGSGSTHAIAGFGITFTAGASPGAMTIGDTATFDIRPVNNFNRKVTVGGIADVFPEFGCMVYAQKSGTGAIFEIDCFRMKSIGLGLGADRKTFAQNDYTAKAIYDSVRNGICQISDVE